MTEYLHLKVLTQKGSDLKAIPTSFMKLITSGQTETINKFKIEINKKDSVNDFFITLGDIETDGMRVSQREIYSSNNPLLIATQPEHPVIKSMFADLNTFYFGFRYVENQEKNNHYDDPLERVKIKNQRLGDFFNKNILQSFPGSSKQELDRLRISFINYFLNENIFGGVSDPFGDFIGYSSLMRNGKKADKDTLIKTPISMLTSYTSFTPEVNKFDYLDIYFSKNLSSNDFFKKVIIINLNESDDFSRDGRTLYHKYWNKSTAVFYCDKDGNLTRLMGLPLMADRDTKIIIQGHSTGVVNTEKFDFHATGVENQTTKQLVNAIKKLLPQDGGVIKRISFISCRIVGKDLEANGILSDKTSFIYKFLTTLKRNGILVHDVTASNQDIALSVLGRKLTLTPFLYSGDKEVLVDVYRNLAATKFSFHLGSDDNISYTSKIGFSIVKGLTHNRLDNSFSLMLRQRHDKQDIKIQVSETLFVALIRKQ